MKSEYIKGFSLLIRHDISDLDTELVRDERDLMDADILVEYRPLHALDRAIRVSI
ncbi:MAG: hypothetical protein OXE44_13030 [Nitrospinae bacterium]|nr:hypothetical protein [Nitrospinota bacterium]